MSQVIQRLHIDSDNYVRTGTKFSVRLADIVGSNKTPVDIRVVSTCFPMLMYNIIAGANDTIVVDTLTYTMPEGVYTAATLASTVQTITGLIVNIAETGSIKTTISSGVAFNMSCTSIDSPSILFLLGFASNSYTGATSYESEGMCSLITDRYIFITCDQCRGENSRMDSGSYVTKPWLRGVLDGYPITRNVTELATHEHYADAPWKTIVKTDEHYTLTFDLVREKYSSFGSGNVSWSFILEVRYI